MRCCDSPAPVQVRAHAPTHYRPLPERPHPPHPRGPATALLWGHVLGAVGCRAALRVGANSSQHLRATRGTREGDRFVCVCARACHLDTSLWGARLRYRSLSPPGRLNGPLSGAEWWTLVIDESDEVCGPSAARAAFTVRHTRFHLGRLPLGQGLPCRGGARSECVSTHCNGHVSLDIPSLDCLNCEHFDAHRSDPSDDAMDAQHW